ncbi:hypothetical protein ColLi_12376 [Colletotrichum liriopes]|uniref:Uncharacterized protein n=1 Tax=Colletotrichum liriopes TaxID=708192 RepID=A0AA37GY99_9PEZI|nr:hypothetical protein ColLi_12376 [Colletotrichum liriopes]
MELVPVEGQHHAVMLFLEGFGAEQKSAVKPSKAPVISQILAPKKPNKEQKEREKKKEHDEATTDARRAQ